MTVHLFGGASSPGCSNFALKRTADDHEEEFGTDIADTLRHNFYVDDMLKSVPQTIRQSKWSKERRQCARKVDSS